MRRVLIYSCLFIALFFFSTTERPRAVAAPAAAPVPQPLSVFKFNLFEKAELIGTGTGWVGLSTSGQLRMVTNSHICVDNGVQTSTKFKSVIDVKLDDGTKLIKLLFDPFNDLCLLQFPDSYNVKNTRALLLSKEPPTINQPIIVKGHPNGGPLSLTLGSYIDETYVPIGFFNAELVMSYGEQMDCVGIPSTPECLYMRRADTINVLSYPGNSGSPVLASDGSVLSMIWGAFTLNAKSLAVPHRVLKRYL